VTTMSFVAKRALRNALKLLAADGAPLGVLGIDGVHYAWPGNKGMKRHIYLGGTRSTSIDDATAGQNDTLIREQAVLTFYIRIVVPSSADPDDDPVEAADRIAEDAGDAIGAWLGTHRDFAGPGTHASFTFTVGDYSSNDTEVVSVLAYAVTVTGYLRLTPQPEGT
jgi:hypothetical protein